ncbi:MAG: YggS family pyridoxal phosphate-dependent enzyme [Flavobacteriaceae bacterium]
MKIAENLLSIRQQIPEDVELVAVSKTKSEAEILEAYKAGQRIFGENKIQEMSRKWEVLPKDISWHMIGHVQTNKIKYMAPFVDLIHGVDRLKLLKEINKQGEKNNRVLGCLLQVHIAQEDTKFGLSETELEEILQIQDEFKYISVCGLMGMATFTEDTSQIQQEFKFLNQLFIQHQEQHPKLQILSMGMSGDFPLAIDCGSTMIRVGSKIFGARNY